MYDFLRIPTGECRFAGEFSVEPSFTRELAVPSSARNQGKTNKSEELFQLLVDARRKSESNLNKKKYYLYCGQADSHRQKWELVDQDLKSKAQINPSSPKPKKRVSFRESSHLKDSIQKETPRINISSIFRQSPRLTVETPLAIIKPQKEDSFKVASQNKASDELTENSFKKKTQPTADRLMMANILNYNETIMKLKSETNKLLKSVKLSVMPFPMKQVDSGTKSKELFIPDRLRKTQYSERFKKSQASKSSQDIKNFKNPPKTAFKSVLDEQSLTSLKQSLGKQSTIYSPHNICHFHAH